MSTPVAHAVKKEEAPLLSLKSYEDSFKAAEKFSHNDQENETTKQSIIEAQKEIKNA